MIQSFHFNEENLSKLQEIITHYPEGRQASAVLPALDLAQRQLGGWISQAAIETVAELLNMPVMRVYEVATFYTMFNLKPVGKYHLQVCGTTPCWLRGAHQIIEAIEKHLNLNLSSGNVLTPDGMFSLCEVECLGACVNAPMIQINDDYFEDLTPELMISILDKLKSGQMVKIGSQTGRYSSEPEGMHQDA